MIFFLTPEDLLWWRAASRGERLDLLTEARGEVEEHFSLPAISHGVWWVRVGSGWGRVPYISLGGGFKHHLLGP